MGFSRQQYWIRLPFPSPGDLPNPGIELASLVSSALAGGFFTIWEAPLSNTSIILKFEIIHPGVFCYIEGKTLESDT